MNQVQMIEGKGHFEQQLMKYSNYKIDRKAAKVKYSNCNWIGITNFGWYYFWWTSNFILFIKLLSFLSFLSPTDLLYSMNFMMKIGKALIDKKKNDKFTSILFPASPSVCVLWHISGLQILISKQIFHLWVTK